MLDRRGPGAVAGGEGRRLEIAAAVVRERLLDLHVRRVLEFAEHARARLSAPRALEIYVRLHRLGDAESEMLSRRVLSALGKPLRAGPRPARSGGVELEELGWHDSRSVWQRIRRRLRGRVDRELRRWVELHTARVEVEVLQAHVEGAVKFLEILQPEGELSEAVELYAHMLDVRPSLGEALYYLTLTRYGGTPPVTATDAPADRSRGGWGAAPGRAAGGSGK